MPSAVGAIATPGRQDASQGGRGAQRVGGGRLESDGSESALSGTSSAQTAVDMIETTTPALSAAPSQASMPNANLPHRLSQVDGGWLSPEHRLAERLQTRISIEQANRTPALFFESGGAHRVYVPTDPIFEDGSSRPRRDAPLVLARVAALLSLPATPRVVLEVHSDSAGIEESQVELSRRRAEIVRSWLVDRGHVSAARFDMVPVGGGRPLVPPDGDYGAQQPNRRIEIRLVEPVEEE
jgi:outer membrane protein OmpA-like peptidoglycan-associated protein